MLLHFFVTLLKNDVPSKLYIMHVYQYLERTTILTDNLFY